MNSSLQYLAIILFSIPGILYGQDCRPENCQSCPCLMEKADCYARQKKYEKAIQLYSAAGVCDPSQKSEADEKIITIFNAIRNLQKQAEENAKRAVKAQLETQSALSLAQQARESANIEAERAKLAEEQAKQALADARKAKEEVEIQFRQVLANDIITKVYSENLGRSEAFRLLEYANLIAPDNPRAIKPLFETVYSRGLFLEETLHSFQDDVVTTSFSPSGEHLAVSDGYEITIFDSNTRRELLALDVQGGCWKLSWSPDGTKLAGIVYADSLIRIWDIPNRKELMTLKNKNEPVFTLAWSSDGNLLASSHKESVSVWDLSSGKQSFRIPHEGLFYNKSSWSPDGRMRAIKYGSQIEIWKMANRKKITILEGHKKEISSISWSPDNRTLASGSWDNTIRIWDVPSGEELLVLEGHKGTVRSVDWFPDGKRIVSVADDNQIKIWDVYAQQELWSEKGHDALIWSVDVSPDGKSIVSGSKDKTAKIWKVNEYPDFLTIRSSGESRTIAWSPDGSKIASAGGGGIISIWRAQTGEELFSFLGGEVQSLDWSPDGNKIVFGDSDGRMTFFDIQAQKEIFSEKRDLLIWSVDWSSNGKFIASGGREGIVKIWDVTAKQEILNIDDPKNEVSCVAWSPDNTKLAFSTILDDNITIWDVANNKRLLKFKAGYLLQKSLGWSPDGSRIAACDTDYDLKIWDAATGREIVSVPEEVVSAYSLAWSPDGKMIALGHFQKISIRDAITGEELFALPVLPESRSTPHEISWSPDGRFLTAPSRFGIDIWDIETKKNLSSEKRHWNFVTKVSWAPTEDKFATASWDKTIKIWDAESGRLLNSMKVNEALRALEWSPDGNRLGYVQCDNLAFSSSAEHTVTIWDISRQKEVFSRKWHTSQIRDMAWSPDGDKVGVAAKSRSAKIWNVTTEEELAELVGHEKEVNCIAWSPEGSLIATGSMDETIKIWDAGSGEEIATLVDKMPRKGDVNSIAWSPDGRKIVASSYGYPSYTISVWDISTLQVLLILQVPESPIRSVAWSPDGKFIIAGSDKSDIIIWDAENGQVIHTFQINLPVEEVGFIPGRPGWIYGRCKLHLHLFSIYPEALISEGRGRLSFGYLSPRAITDFGLEESFEYAGITVENLIEEGDERWMFAVADYFLHRAEELEGNLQLSKEYYEKAGQLYSALEKNAYFYLPETYRKRRGIVQKALESH